MALGEVGDVRMCKRVLKQQTREYGDVPFYKIGTFGGVADAFISYALFDEFKRKYSFPKKGDILISAAGTIGRTVAYDGAPAYFQDSNIVWIENDESKITNAYLWHRYQVTKWAVSHGGTVARLYNDNLRTKIHVTAPSLPEQRAITTALSDVDALLAKVEQLIAKKRDLKQAAMQQLLTGKIRLPGFSGAWEVRRLGESCELITKGTTPTSIGRSFMKSGVNFLKAESIAENGAPIPDKVAFIDATTHRLLNRSQLKDGDLLISIAGVLGRVGRVSQDILPANTNQALAIIRLGKSSELDGGFLFFCLRSPMTIKQIADVNVQAAQANISLQNVQDLEVHVPPTFPEQTAIANVLSDMDAELAALEARRDKTRALKQGMMQELLTGRIRLV